MKATEITEDGYYWMRLPCSEWGIVKATWVELKDYGKILHILRPGDTWHTPVNHEAEFQGPIPKPS
jgi:hypothetical protein